MRPRIFLRTTEFLWQEGHTVHASADEAMQEAVKMLKVYQSFMEECLALPVIVGEKSPGERFPGAENTFCLEAMMQDRKAIQAGTSHYLGQNFAKASNIRFSNKDGETQHAFTTSWGVTTRLIGGLIMCHGDDDGLRLPPRVATKQAVVIPFVPKPEMEAEVLAYAEKVVKELQKCQFFGQNVSVFLDKRDMRGGEKNWEWIKKGVPLRLEVGPREMEASAVMVSRRDRPHKEKERFSLEDLRAKLPSILEEMQAGYLNQARTFRDQHTERGLKTFEELKAFFTPQNSENPEVQGGFVLAKWCGDKETENMLEELKVTIRCLPLDQSGTEGKCILTGRPAKLDAIFAKSY